MPERAPMLSRIWRDLAPTIAAMIVVDGTVARRLSLAPRRDIHAVAAYIRAARTTATPVERMASVVASTDPRDLLAQAIPDLHPRLFRLLDRAGEVVRDLDFYRRTNRALMGPSADSLLAADQIGEATLRVAETLAEGDPVLLAAQRAFAGCPSRLDTIKKLVDWLRATGLAHDIEALPAGSGVEAVIRRARSDLARATAPTVAIWPPPGWRLLRTVAELWAVATQHRNCIRPGHLGSAGFVHHLLAGHAFLARADALVHLRPLGGDHWVVEQIGLSRYAPSDRPAIFRDLRDGLRSTGVVLLDVDPVAGLFGLQQARGEAGNEDMDLLADLVAAEAA